MEEVDLDPGEIVQIGIEEKDGLGPNVNFKEEEDDSPVGENFKEESLTRAPLLEDPVYRANLKTRIRTDVIIDHQRGHFVAECPDNNKRQTQKTSEGKKFEDYTYAYGGADEPQLATATTMPQAYEEALTAMRQSLKNQDPLHGLNM